MPAGNYPYTKEGIDAYVRNQGLEDSVTEDDKYQYFLAYHGIADPNNPGAYYDYRAAYEANEQPVDGEWSSKYKHDLSHERYEQRSDGQWYDTKYDKLATTEEVVMQAMNRMDFESLLFNTKRERTNEY